MICELFTPLKIYNGTPEGRPIRDSMATLAINQLKGNPPLEDCPIQQVYEMFIGVIFVCINIIFFLI